MAGDRAVHVYLLPNLAPAERMRDGIAVVIDVLRATTTIVHALAAGCVAVRPCAEVDEARALADSLPAGKVILGGERGGLPPEGFDLGNSPRTYTCRACKDTTLVFTTTNGTRAILRCEQASRILIAAFVNYSAVCEQLRQDKRPVYIVCAGTDGDITLEDTLLAGAIVEALTQRALIQLNDGARLAWDCFEQHGHYLDAALELGHGGQNLLALGLEEDIRDAARVDAVHLVPEVRHDPLRIEVGAVGIVSSYWRKK